MALHYSDIVVFWNNHQLSEFFFFF